MSDFGEALRHISILLAFMNVPGGSIREGNGELLTAEKVIARAERFLDRFTTREDYD